MAQDNTPAKRELNLQTDRLPRNEAKICYLITRLNQIQDYKNDLPSVLSWKDSLLRIKPDVDLVALEMAVDGMLEGLIPYDPKIGIKNIFNALQRVVIDEDTEKYKILKPI